MGRFVFIEPLEDRTLFSRAVGIDVASYQHPITTQYPAPYGTPINWNSVYAAGVQFAYVKATQSNDYINPNFISDMAQATAAGIVAGAYDFGDWTISPTTDASHFLATAAPYISAGYLRPMLDAEQATSSNVSSWVNTWCNAIYSATGVKPIVYTYQSFAANYLDSSVTQWPLWMASPNGQNSQTGNPTATTPWSTWAIWQWGGANVNGISGGVVDQDVANGDMTTYVIPQLVGASTQFTFGQTVHVNAANGVQAYSTYTSNGSYVTEPKNTNGLITGNPVYLNGALRFPVQYAGSSSTTWSVGASLSAGGVPVVNSVTAAPNPAAISAPMTLTASVSDPDSTVKSVAFYLESNGTTGLQTGSGGDTLVGTATSGSSGKWSVTITSPAAVGTYTYYAVATDVSGIASSAGSGTSTVATSSILNPGFETPAVGSGSSADYEFAPASAGWTFSGYSGVSGNGSMFTAGNPNAPEGTQVGFLEYANSSVSQAISMNGGTYLLGFYAAQRANTQASQQDFEVLIDGSVVGQFTPNSTSYQQYLTSPFTVAAGNHTIKLLGLDTAGGNNTVFIDNVQMLLSTTTSLAPPTGPNPSNATQPLAFSATVSGSIPNGETVMLLDSSNNNAVVATGTLSGGSATLTVPAGTLLAGTHNLVAIYGGDSTFAASQAAAFAQTVQVVVTNVQLNGNLPSLLGVQRSMVDSIVYSFSEAVNLSGAAATIAVHSGQSGTAPTLTWTALNPNSDGSATQWAVSFSGAGVVGNSIANGVYDITLTPADVTSDANPTANVQARSTDTFYRLFGDINGDGVVNAADNFQLRTALTTYNGAFDYNDDGVVNAADNFQFRNSMSLSFSNSGVVYTI